MQIRNIGDRYCGGDDDTGMLRTIDAGETVTLGEKMGQRLLETFPEQFVAVQQAEPEAQQEVVEDEGSEADAEVEEPKTGRGRSRA